MSGETQDRTITVALYDLLEERTVGQCGPFDSVEDAQAFMAEHVDKLAQWEQLRAGYLPDRAQFVEIVERRAAGRASSGAHDG